MAEEQSAQAPVSGNEPAEQADEVKFEEPKAADPLAELQAALTEAQHQAAQNRDRYLRMAAELDNLRKRTQRDLENAHKFALERFLTELLPVKDSLEMGIAAADAGQVAAIREGMDMTLKLLAMVLDRFGVREVNPARGEAFDPELHEAMAMQASAETGSGAILLTVQKGYQLHGRLLRPARVIVAKSPAGAA